MGIMTSRFITIGLGAPPRCTWCYQHMKPWPRRVFGFDRSLGGKAVNVGCSTCQEAIQSCNHPFSGAMLVSGGGYYLEDHPRTGKWLLTMVSFRPLRIGLWDPFQMAWNSLYTGGDLQVLLNLMLDPPQMCFFRINSTKLTFRTWRYWDVLLVLSNDRYLRCIFGPLPPLRGGDVLFFLISPTIMLK